MKLEDAILFFFIGVLVVLLLSACATQPEPDVTKQYSRPHWLFCVLAKCDLRLNERQTDQ